MVTEEGKHRPTNWLESRQGKGGSNRGKREWLEVISELTRDGQNGHTSFYSFKGNTKTE